MIIDKREGPLYIDKAGNLYTVFQDVKTRKFKVYTMKNESYADWAPSRMRKAPWEESYGEAWKDLVKIAREKRFMNLINIDSALSSIRYEESYGRWGLELKTDEQN